MNENERVVRRANVDDLSGLRILWERAHLQVLDVEKRLTEFQLIASVEGDLIGAVALHIDRKQGAIHSEAFLRPEDAGEARPLLWERLQSLARNHGLIRLWTRETAPFWSEAGFVEPSPEVQATLPEGLAGGPGRWLTLGLRDESVSTISVEKEFELFQQAQRASTEELIAQAKRLKIIVVSLLLLLVMAAMLAAVWFVVKQDRPGRDPARPARSAWFKLEPAQPWAGFEPWARPFRSSRAPGFLRGYPPIWA
jgi:hypothetical protein